MGRCSERARPSCTKSFMSWGDLESFPPRASQQLCGGLVADGALPCDLFCVPDSTSPTRLRELRRPGSSAFALPAEPHARKGHKTKGSPRRPGSATVSSCICCSQKADGYSVSWSLDVLAAACAVCARLVSSCECGREGQRTGKRMRTKQKAATQETSVFLVQGKSIQFDLRMQTR
jgi:hypothetical protein